MLTCIEYMELGECLKLFSSKSFPSPCLLSKNASIKIYRSVVLPVVLYERETWSVILRKEHTLRVLLNRVPREIFWSKGEELTGDWRKLHNESFMIDSHCQILFRWSNQRA